MSFEQDEANNSMNRAEINRVINSSLDKENATENESRDMVLAMQNYAPR